MVHNNTYRDNKLEKSDYIYLQQRSHKHTIEITYENPIQFDF